MKDEDSSGKQHLIDNQEIDDQDDPSSKKPRYKFDGLTNSVIWAYSIGHIFNDLCASAWFNFLLFYLTKVLNFERGSYSMLAGQIFDALGTPSAGILSDKYNTRIGKRIPWYIFSYVFVMLTFVPMWCYPILNTFLPMDSDGFRTFFFIFFPSLFNYTWAFGYIAHISLVPSMTCSRVNRDVLNTRRNTFTFIANMLLLLIALLLFNVVDGSDYQFQALGIICGGIGIITTAVFLIFVKEVPLTKQCNEAVKNIKAILKQREGKNRQSLLLQDGNEENENENNIKQARSETINKTSSCAAGGKSEVLTSAKQQEYQKFINAGQQNQKSQSIEQNDEAEIVDKYGNKIDDVIFSGVDNKDEDENNENENNGQDNLYENQHETHQLRVSVLRSNRTNSLSDNIVNWKQWFKEKQFYQYGLVFMFARLFCNVVTTMMNFYLYYVIKINGETDNNEEVKLTFQLALIPLLLYISSVGASSILNFLYQKIGRKKTYSLGVFLMLISIGPMAFLSSSSSFLKNLIYPIACIAGAAQALQLNTAINLISEVIGLRGAGGAFVFGAYSFLDKLVTGIVLFAITENSLYKDNNPDFIRWVTVIIPIASGIAAWVLILLGEAKDYDPKNKNAKLSRMSLGDEFVS